MFPGPSPFTVRSEFEPGCVEACQYSPFVLLAFPLGLTIEKKNEKERVSSSPAMGLTRILVLKSKSTRLENGYAQSSIFKACFKMIYVYYMLLSFFSVMYMVL